MTILSSRREFFYAYDIKMGNPNGDPDENRPRVLPDGTHYVTDVRLKRFVRDFCKALGKDILVDTIDHKSVTLTGRVLDYLEKKGKEKVEGEELVNILLDTFIDARLFGSSFAFKKQKNSKGDDVELKAVPKTLTGAVQINHGEVMHQAESVDIHGTSVFGSKEDKTQGTFTTYFALRYALIGFNGIANEHSAKLSKMTEADYSDLLKAMWKSVRSAGNTRTKVGQNPRLLVSIQYKPGVEFQFGNLSDYISLKAKNGKPERQWASPADYLVDISLLQTRIKEQKAKIEKVEYCVSPDIKFAKEPDSTSEIVHGALVTTTPDIKFAKEPDSTWEKIDLDEWKGKGDNG